MTGSSQALIQRRVVKLDHHAIDLVIEGRAHRRILDAMLVRSGDPADPHDAGMDGEALKREPSKALSLAGWQGAGGLTRGQGIEEPAHPDAAQGLGILALHQPGAAVAGIHQGLVARGDQALIERDERSRRQIEFAPDLEAAPLSHRDRHGPAGDHLGRDHITGQAITARCGLDELTSFIDQTDRHAVDLGLDAQGRFAAQI